MIENKKVRMENFKSWFIPIMVFVFVIFVLLISSLSFALSVNVPSLVVAQESQEISFEITIQDNLSNVTVEKNSSLGSIIVENNTYKFNWVVSYDSKGFEEILFTVNDNETTKSASVIIAKPPVISGYSNDYINSDSYQIQLNTDISSTCKYSLSNKSFNQMDYTLQKNIDGIAHEGRTPNLQQNNYVIYLICRSDKGAESSASFNLEVNLNPSAQIRLKPPSPIRSGIIEVELITSEDLLFAPELKYYFDDDATLRSVTLTGSSNVWKGYLVIQETDKRRIGTFTFLGTDKTNLEGTDITSGKIFIVDNYRPESVSSISGSIQSNAILLEWRYVDDEADGITEYRVYKKTTKGGVDYVDYLTTTSRNYYYDYDVVYGEAYYYKVSAVNHAGREGVLSKELALTFIPLREQESSSKSDGLSDSLKFELSTKISEVDKLLLDIGLAESKIQSLTNKEHLVFVQDLGILAKIVASKNKLNNIKTELASLEKKDLSFIEFDLASSKLINEANDAWLKTPVNVEVVDSIVYQEVFDSPLLIEKYLESEELNTSLKEVQDLLNDLIILQSSVMVDVNLIKGRVLYPEFSDNVSLVKKTISSDDIQDIVVLDNVALNDYFGKVVFVDKPVFVKDFLVKWNVNLSGSKTFSYYLLEDVSVDLVKNTAVFVVKSQDVVDKRNLITGLVTSSSEKSSGNVLFIPIILGIVSVLFLSVYYFKSVDDSFSDVLSFRNFNFNWFNKNDSHKKLNLDKPPSPVNETSDVDSSNKESFDLSAIEMRGFEVSSQEVIIDSNIIDDDVENKKSDQHIASNNAGFNFNKKNNGFTNESSVDLNEEVIDALSEIRDLVEDIYYTKGKFNDFDEDFHYVSKVRKLRRNFLKNAPFGKEFILCDGQTLKNLKELRDSLRFMNDGVFNYHVNSEKNDFYFWVKDVFGYNSLAFRIKNVKSRKELLKKLKI